MAISDTITSMYENVGEVYDTITNVTLPEHKNIENIPRTIRDSYLQIMNNGIDVIYDNWEKVTGSGESLSLTPTEEAKMGIIYKGNTYQNTSILPSEYQQVEYIESDEHCYIDMGVKGTQNTKIITSALFKDGGTFLGDITDSSQAISLRFAPSNTGAISRFGNKSVTGVFTTYSYNVKYLIETSSEGIFVDNIKIHQWGDVGTFETSKNMYLFTNTTTPTSLQMILYSCKVYNGNTLIRDFIPCYRNSDNEVGLYDLVNNVFYTNQGTGTFTKGNNVSIPNPDYPQPIQVVSGDNSIEVVGKNLIPTQTSAWEQGTISSTTGQNSSSTTRIRTIDYYPIANDTNYYISVQNTNYRFLNIHFYDTSKAYLGNMITLDNSVDGKTSAQINIPSLQMPNVAYMRVITKNNNNSTTILASEVEAIKPMIELGTTATNFEPYQSASYPINLPEGMELCKIGDYQDRIFKSSGKNLWKPISFTKTSSGITFTYNTDGSINCNNTSTGNALSMSSSDARTNNYLVTLEAGTYTLSGNTNDIRLEAVDSEGSALCNTATSNQFTLSTEKQVFIRANILSGKTFSNVKIYPMLNKGSTALPYEPYGTGWYLNKQTGKVVLNGTETITGINTSKANTTRLLYNNVLNENTSSGTTPDTSRCNRLVASGIWNADREGYYFDVGSKTLTIRINKTTIGTTIEEANTYIANNNLIFYYQLLTPTYNEITDSTLLGQLEVIKTSYENQTNISQENNDLPFILDVSALKKV